MHILRAVRGSFVFAAGAALFLAGSAADAVTFNASFAPIKIAAKPGQVLTTNYRLALDDGDPRTHFKVEVQDWWRSEDGRQSFYAPAGSISRSCGHWVSANPMEATVSGGQALQIRLTVSIPQDVQPGGYWCALSVDEMPDPLDIAPVPGASPLGTAGAGEQGSVLWSRVRPEMRGDSADAGAHWDNVTPKELPAWSTVSMLEPSPHNADVAYLAIDRHKLDDIKPYAWKTHDRGKSWTRISAGLPDGAVVHAVREDPVRDGLLYAGTERGVFVSFDDGAHWQSLQLNLPPSPIHDLVVKNDDLVVATHDVHLLRKVPESLIMRLDRGRLSDPTGALRYPPRRVVPGEGA